VILRPAAHPTRAFARRVIDGVTVDRALIFSLLALDRQSDHTGTILATFVLTALRFIVPNIGIRDYQTRFGRRNGHRFRYFGSSKALR